MSIRFLVLCGLLVLVWPSAVSGELSLDISPIRMEVAAEAGAEYTDAIKVLNTGEKPARIRVRLKDWFLDEEGTPIFRPAGTVSRTASPWIAATPGDFLVEPGQTQYVRFTVTVPPDAAESGYHGCIFLESLPVSRAEQGHLRMFIQGSVACMIYLRVGNPERSARLTSLEALDRDGQAWVRMQILNTGNEVIRLAGDVTCVADDLEVATPESLPDVPVLPGARRWVEVELPEDTPRENVLARVTMDLAGFGLIVGECPLEPSKADLVR